VSSNVLERSLRSAILGAADSETVRRFVMRHGHRLGARRFVAGETIDDFLAVARRLNERGFAVAAGILGEGVREPAEARAATEQYRRLLETFAKKDYDASIALKLTHLGLDIDPELAFENAALLAQSAEETRGFMRLDMEQSRYVDATLATYRRLRERFTRVGFVLQSYLYRSADDLRAHLRFAPNVRLVKGAYLENPDAAYERKADVDRAYVNLARIALSHGGFTAIATHDRRLIAAIEAFADLRGLPKNGRYEFQLLYGVATQLAQRLVQSGYRVRVAVPFGKHWFPYLMRRLAERPANLGFVLKNAFALD